MRASAHQTEGLHVTPHTAETLVMYRLQFIRLNIKSQNSGNTCYAAAAYQNWTLSCQSPCKNSTISSSSTIEGTNKIECIRYSTIDDLTLLLFRAYYTGLPEDLIYLVDVGHLESVAAGMEVLLDCVQGALQDSALLWGQAALTLLRDVLKKPFL